MSYIKTLTTVYCW